MPNAVTTELIGWRNPRSGRFVAATKGAEAQLAKAARAAGKDYVKLAADGSPVAPARPLRGRGGKRSEQESISTSWKFQVSETAQGAELTLSNSSPHFGYVVGGTRPHEIRPTHAKALAWQGSGGGFHFAKRVHHPGTKPNPFVQAIVTRITREATDDLARVARQVVTDIDKAFA